MALSITHTFVSAIADDPVALAAGEVCPQSHWNAAHTIAPIAGNSIVGNNSASPAVPVALTAAQATALLSVFTSGAQGVVPASGGGTTNFLRADGSWAAPTGGAVSSVSNSDGTLTISPTTGAVVASLNTAQANTWSAAQTFNSGDLLLAGSGSGHTTLNAAATASGTLTLPAATDTLVGRATTDTLTNKTIASTTDVLGGVTMTLGSDAVGDVYYRNNSGVLTRLAAGAAGQILGVSAGLPAWSNAGRPTVLSGNTTYYVRTVPANCTISNASPAVVSLTAHGLSVNDPVVFCTPNNRTSGITVTLASPGAFTWTAHGLSAGFPVQFNSTGALPTGLTAGTTYYVTNNAALTTNGFNVSDTQAHALAGTNTVNTSGSQSGTHWGNWAGVAPTGVTFGTIYYVISAGFGANAFEFSATQGGSAVNTSGASVGQMQVQTGNDANAGNAQTRTGAWLTSTHAEAYLAANVDLAGFIATIQYAAGYYDGINVRHQWYSSIGDFNASLEASAYFVGADQLGNTILQDNTATSTGSISINAFTDINQVQFYFNNVECRPTLDACVHASYDENANLTAMAHLGQPSGAGGTLYYNGSGTDKLLNGAIIDDQGNTTHVVVGLGSAVKFWQVSGAATGLQPSLLGNLTLLNQPNFSTAFIYISNQAFAEYLIPLTGTTTGKLASSPTLYFVTEGSEFRHPGNSQTWTAFGLTVGQTQLPTVTQRHGRSYNYGDTPYSIQDIGTTVIKSGPLTLSNGLNSNVDWSSGDVGGMGVVYISGPTSAFSIGGWQKYLAGLTFKIYNTTSQTMTIVNNDASSTTNYRINTSTGANVAVTGPGWAEFWYDTVVKRWILVNASQPAGGGSPASPSGSLQYDNGGSFGAFGTTDGSSLLQLGAADAASPVAQTLQPQNVVAGTSNTASPNWSINGALSTGTGAAGGIVIGMGFAGGTQSGTTVTISIATPAVITLAAHGFGFGQAVQFATTGSLPTGITAGTTYYVTPTGGNGSQSGTFQISTSLANCIAQTYVNTTGSQSGTQSVSSVNTAQNGPVPVLTVGPSSINGTGSSTLPALTISQHWNSSGNQANKTVLLINLDEQEAGNNGQQIITAKVNGSAKFYVTDSGAATFDGEVFLNGFPSLTWSGGAGQGTLVAGSTYAQFDGALNSTNLVITPLNWLTINNGTTAVGTFIYNTTDSKTSLGTNYERVALDWRTTSNVFTFGPQAGGSGTLRYMQQTTAFAAAAPTTKTGNYSQALTDQWLIFNGSASITLTLLSAATYPGLSLLVRTIAAQTVVSASSNVVPLAGGAAGTAILSGTAGKWALLVSDGTNWQIQASN